LTAFLFNWQLVLGLEKKNLVRATSKKKPVECVDAHQQASKFSIQRLFRSSAFSVIGIF
jgi:hypothetical protein